MARPPDPQTTNYWPFFFTFLSGAGSGGEDSKTRVARPALVDVTLSPVPWALYLWTGQKERNAL